VRRGNILTAYRSTDGVRWSRVDTRTITMASNIYIGQQAALLGVAYEAARTIPVAALDLAVALPPTRERDDLLEHAVSQWAETDADLATVWVSAVPDQSLRQRLTSAVAIVLSEQDVVAAVTLAVNSLDAGDEQDRAVVSIVQRWAQYFPEAAAAWVSQFPDIPLRDPVVHNLLTLWTAQDAEAAGRVVARIAGRHDARRRDR
jgi:hypothetical protein